MYIIKLESHLHKPSPENFTWMIDENGVIPIRWNTRKSAPDEVVKLVYCSCTKNYVQGSCSCFGSSLPLAAYNKQYGDNCTRHQSIALVVMARLQMTVMMSVTFEKNFFYRYIKYSKFKPFRREP